MGELNEQKPSRAGAPPAASSAQAGRTPTSAPAPASAPANGSPSGTPQRPSDGITRQTPTFGSYGTTRRIGGPTPAGPAGQPGVPSQRPLPLKPRKVRGGVKLPAAATTMTSQLAAQVGLSKEGAAGKNIAKTADEMSGTGGALSWASHRWVRLMEQAAEGLRLVDGLEYARLGQTRKFTITNGGIDALVQGRSERAYITRIVFDVFEEAQWEKVVAAMSAGAIYGAKLLSGELPANIEDIFAPMGLKLFPLEPAEVKVSCTCGEAALTSPLSSAAITTAPSGTPVPSITAAPVSTGTPPATPPANGWCKHVCCVAHLFAARLATEPFLMFGIRGLDVEEIRERLRERRATASIGAGAMPVYAQRVPGASDVPSKPLEECVDDFWDAGPGLRELELPIGPPPVSHPLLRRLGPSPFTGAAFPLVGLLASCYEAISAEAMKETEALEPMPEPEPNELTGDDEAE